MFLNEINKELVRNAPTKQQIKLFERVRILYPSAELEYQYHCQEGGIYYIDIAIPEHKIAIEFDGQYWHNEREENDRKRQEALERWLEVFTV